MENELEKKSLKGSVLKTARPFKPEKVKGLIPNPTVTDSDGKKALLFKK